MNIFLRILLAVYAFFLTILSVISMFITFKPEILDGVYDYMTDSVLSTRDGRVCMFIIAFIFFILSIIFLLSGVRTSRDKRAISKYTNIGEIKISLTSIENIALAASKKLMGVRESKAYVKKEEDGVAISVKTVVMSDINIPALSEDMQVKIKNSVEDSTGIKVNDVKVLIESIYTGYKARVE